MSPLVDGAASAAGTALAGASRALAWLRPSRKPLHPKGEIVTGRLVRTGGGAESGVPWLDSVGEDDVVIRFSRAIGLPHAVPDIHGIAIRVPAEDGFGDLLLASTGLGKLTRFVLTASHDVAGRPLTTLLPYQGPHGPILIGAQAVEGLAPSFDLLWSRGTGPWFPFARLAVSEVPGTDPAISFDPVRNPLPGLAFYPWVRRLREPAYRAARSASGR